MPLMTLWMPNILDRCRSLPAQWSLTTFLIGCHRTLIFRLNLWPPLRSSVEECKTESTAWRMKNVDLSNENLDEPKGRIYSVAKIVAKYLYVKPWCFNPGRVSLFVSALRQTTNLPLRKFRISNGNDCQFLSLDGTCALSMPIKNLYFCSYSFR